MVSYQELHQQNPKSPNSRTSCSICSGIARCATPEVTCSLFFDYVNAVKGSPRGHRQCDVLRNCWVR